MQGDLFHYKGIVGGFRKVSAIIGSSDFVAYQPNTKKELLRIPLDPEDTNKPGVQLVTEVQPNTRAKDNQQFYLVRQ